MKQNSIVDFLKKHTAEWIILAVTFAVFAQSLSFDFLTDWDDSAYVVHNPYLTFSWENIVHCFTTDTIGLLTPLTSFSFMLDHLIWQTREVAFGYRLTNLLLHAGCALLLLNILKRLGIRTALACFCVLLWVIHPQRLESVVWISERKDVLSGFFALASFLVFMKAPGKWKNILGAVLLFLLSLLAKPSAIGLPLAACVYLCYINPEKFNWKYIFAGIAGMSGIVLLLCWFLNIYPDFIPMPRLLSVVSHNALFYFTNGIIPWETNPCYPYVDWHDFWLIPATAGIIAAILFFGRKAGMSWKWLGMYFLAAGLVFCAMFAPFTGAFRFNPTDYADRYSYFPNLAVWTFLGYFLEQLFRKKENLIPGFRIIGIVLIICSAAATLWYQPFWKDSQTLARWAVYSYELPNDKFLMHHVKTGFITQDPTPIEEALVVLRKKQQIPDIPRDDERYRTGRNCTIDMLEIAVEILKTNFDQAVIEYDQFALNNKKILLLEKHLYEGQLKYLIMQLFIIKKDEQRLAHFETWGKTTTDRYGKVSQDYNITAALKFYKKDYQGAIEDWKVLLKTNPGDPDILANIRIAEDKMKQTR